MSDLFDQLPALPKSPTSAPSGARRLSANGRPIGRPPGARNKGSMDLGRYIEARFGGMTPGQQLAELTLVKPADLRKARRDAKDLGIVDLDVPILTLALVVKATRLAKALGCDKLEAWGMLAAERAKLLPYVHQAQPAAKPKDAGAQLPVMFLADAADMDAAMSAPQRDDTDFVEDFDAPDDQVS